MKVLFPDPVIPITIIASSFAGGSDVVEHGVVSYPTSASSYSLDDSLPCLRLLWVGLSLLLSLIVIVF